jgi:hypothetical protein
MFGKMWSANITQHPTAGISEYTDGELSYLLRTGIKRDGSYAGPWMTFPLLSDEDLVSTIAFLRSDAPEVQPAETRQPPTELSFIGKMVFKLFLPKPFDYPSKPIVAPPPTDKVAYGRYLATGKWECYRCHSANFETNNDLDPGKIGGLLRGRQSGIRQGQPCRHVRQHHPGQRNRHRRLDGGAVFQRRCALANAPTASRSATSCPLWPCSPTMKFPPYGRTCKPCHR